MNKTFEKQYEEINRPYHKAVERYKRTIEVYGLLKECGEALQPKEIAERLNWTYGVFSNHVDDLRFGDAAGAVHRLREMGLVVREEHTKTVDIPNYGGGYYQVKTIVVDGETYTSEKWVANEETTRQIEVTYYKWKAI